MCHEKSSKKAKTSLWLIVLKSMHIHRWYQ
jgi:hypothetical protein